MFVWIAGRGRTIDCDLEIEGDSMFANADVRH